MASAAAQLSLPRIFRSSPDVHCQSSSRHRSAVLPRFTGLKISSPAERIGGENAFRGTSAVPGRKGGKGEPLRLPSALARADVVVAAAEGGTRAPPRDRKQKLAPPSGRAGGAGRSGGGKIPYELEAVISNLVSLAPRGSISRCMETFKGKLALPDFALIFKEFAQRGDWIRAMRLFKYMQRQQWCAPNEYIYTIMIGIMGREGMLDRAQELFEEMPEHGVEWNVYSFTALINAYGRNGMYERSLDLLARMKREGVAANSITYNTVLHACAKGAIPWDALVDIFAKMRQDGVQPDIVTFNTLLAACNARSLVEQSAMVFRSMVASQVPPNALSYASLVDTHRRGGQLGGVRRLFQEMSEEEGVVADVSAYNMLIDAYAWGGEYQAAQEVFNEMQQAGCIPNVATYTALLKALGSNGSYHHVFNEMQQAGCIPNVATYTALLKALGSNGSYHHVRSVFTQMKASGRKPDLATYQTLLDVFISGGFFREASRLFWDMEEDGVEVDEGAFTSLLVACGLGGLTTEATEIYRFMRERSQVQPSSSLMEALFMREQSQVQPSSSLMEALISAYGQAGIYDHALTALHESMEMGLSDQPGPFLALMEAYAAGGMHDDAAFASQKSSPSSPSLTGGSAGPYPADAPLRVFEASQKTFNALIEAFTEGGLYDEAIKVSEDMEEANCRPSLATHAAMDMEQANCRPSLATHAAMVAAYSAAGTFEAAYAQTTEIREEGMEAYAAGGMHDDAGALCQKGKVAGHAAADRGDGGGRNGGGALRRLSKFDPFFSVCCSTPHPPRWQDMRRLIAEMEGGGTGEEHRVVRGLLVGRYESEEFWPIAEDFFGRLKREGVEVNRVFLNALMDALWWAGRRATALKLDSTVLHASPLLSSPLLSSPLLSSPLLSSPLLSSVWCVCPFISSHSFSTQREGVAVNRVFLNALMDALWEGVAVNRVFLNALMDALWWAGRRATALKLHAPVKDASVPLCVSLHSPPAQREGVAVNRVFLNALMDALWWAGRRATALKLHAPATSLAVFPEASYRSPTLWSLDVHRSVLLFCRAVKDMQSFQIN
ncbi:unnamed protein product [Closterium sp. NIES-64]|nr:unnamed protein product [Closterium sp. NIES-64]